VLDFDEGGVFALGRRTDFDVEAADGLVVQDQPVTHLGQDEGIESLV